MLYETHRRTTTHSTTNLFRRELDMKIPYKLLNKLAHIHMYNTEYEDYYHHYNKLDFTPAQFLGLKHIPHQRKVNISLSLLPQDTYPPLLVDISETVLHIYDATFRNILSSIKQKETLSDPDRRAIERVFGLSPYKDYLKEITSALILYTADKLSHKTFKKPSWAASNAIDAINQAAWLVDKDKREEHQREVRKILLKYLNRQYL